jgi:hypothetical protein
MSRTRSALAGSVVCMMATMSFGASFSASSASVVGQSVAPAASEEGRIAYGRYSTQSWFRQRLVVQDADGGNRRIVWHNDHSSLLDGVSLSPDGVWFAVRTYHHLYVRRVDGRGPGTMVTLPTGPAWDTSRASWSPDGTRFAFTARPDDLVGRDVVVADMATLQGHVVSEQADGTFDVQWSPDGEWIAVSRPSTVFGCVYEGEPRYYGEIVKMRPDGTDVTQLTDARPWDWTLIDWGQRGILGLTYGTGEDGDISQPCPDTRFGFDLLQPDTGRNRLLRYHQTTEPLALSPDGTSYLLSERVWPSRIWQVELDGKERRSLVARHGLNGDWGNSPGA